MKKILILGFGTMGKGIAKFFLQNGFIVDIYDHREANKKLEDFKIIINRDLNREKITEKVYYKIINNIKIIPNIESINDNYYLCIEAIKENLEDKINLYKKIEKKLNNDTLIASNTSSIKITDLSEGIENKNRFLGIHFFNPADRMPLIELTKTEMTDIEKYKEIKNFLESLGKEVVEVKDSNGFIVNKILIKSINEAALLLDKEISSSKDIDKAMKSGAGWPMGPLELADYIGLDVCYNILLNFKNIEPDLKISKTLERKIQDNHLGKKSKKGFYEY